ncbi:Putative cytochrome b5-like heme/steroid binding domain, fatty acid desaturase [Colletotrichum destructivum]|uniref:Delta 8-(E)-sphingolipid desaturase n=1 Tax=Colletotrichum destructivum TaxID=34406 RepID=A0AAX4IP98_9PEZI|nr:Putative cytochrome b5-like heme/steroid binding domain, fatty acid desaturase [Colletotrichum destructivum]
MATPTNAPISAAASAPRGKPTKTRVYPLMSRRQVEGLIAQGRVVIIIDQFVVKLDGWLAYHPGGDKAILHMVGRDATDEVSVLHSPEARSQMTRYRIGRVEGHWRNFVPPIQGGKFRALEEGGSGFEDIDDNDDDTMRFFGAPSPSDVGSREASPVFDTADIHVRRRHGAAQSSSPASVSSATSTTDDGHDDKDMDGTAFLDSETRKQIRLDLHKYPALDDGTQSDIVRKYRLLNERIKAEGLYNCDYRAYAIEVMRYTILFAAMLTFLRWGWYFLSAACLGCFWHQLVFSAHDAGHMGITHNFHVDTCIGIFIADFMGGLSIGWWKRNHNVHHIVTNSPEHDPDIEHLPFFAVSHRFLGNLTSSYYERVMEYDLAARFFLSLQSYLYYPIMLFGRFNLYRLSWDHLIMGRGPKKGIAWWHRWLEVAGQVFFWVWFGYGIVYRSIPNNWDRFVFVIISHMFQAPLHVQITLSHFAMSTADLGPQESFPQKMLRTTMDVDCPTWLDFFHGGLQFQVVHHMYPRIPRHNLRKTQRLVQDFCNDVGIPYALYGFVDGNKDVIGRLAEVSRQAAILAKCQKVAAHHIQGGHRH